MFHLRIALTALRGLRQNLLRSMLATLGVIIGVGAVVSAVSILEGTQRDILERFESLGADQLLVFNGSRQRSGRSMSVAALQPEDAERIRAENAQLVLRVAPQYQGAGQIKYLARNVVATVLGTTEEYAPLNNYHVAQGRFLTRENVRGSAMVAVLGHKIAADLFGALPAVGRSIKVNGKSFIVVGVMEEKGSLGFFEVDKQVIVPLPTAMGRLFGSRYLTNLTVQCTAAGRIQACVDGVNKTLRGSHRIRAGAEDDFQVYTQEQIKQQFSQVAIVFQLVLYSIAGISVVVGAIGIMNIMLVSVTERTREIGVRIAVGARRMDILKQFLTEAGLISVFGGAFGLVFGWAVANFLGEFTQMLETYTPPSVIIVGMVMAVVVGIASGIYPAIRAARLDPVQALRYE
ncbi:MAG: ABC transporter permease [Planctomycetes bacterium]|nr:ABC transporter permease [Planctomycetota bacterium]